MTLKSIEKYPDLTHILIYTNTTENCDKIANYIEIILRYGIVNISDLYYKSLHSNTSNVKFTEEISEFKKAKYGIISCVYIFGEGFDLPKLNGVSFAENMNSPIRTTQCAMRPNRLDKETPKKMAYIIIPYLDLEETGICNKSFQKCYAILDKLRNNDEIIEQKINVLSINRNQKSYPNSYGNSDTHSDENENTISNYTNLNMLELNKLELEKIKIRLKYSNNLKSKSRPEKDEYDFIKLLNRELKFKNKKEYADSSNIHKHWIKDPERYFRDLNLWTNWYDFLNIDTSNYIQDIDLWRKFCIQHKLTTFEEYEKNVEKYNELPNMPQDLYPTFTNFKSEFRNIGSPAVPIPIPIATKSPTRRR